jgi:hypothetical protein
MKSRNALDSYNTKAQAASAMNVDPWPANDFGGRRRKRVRGLMARQPALPGASDEGKKGEALFPDADFWIARPFLAPDENFALAAIGEGASLARRFAGRSLER